MNKLPRPAGADHPAFDPGNDMSCETEADYTMAELARKEGAQLGKVLRRDSMGCDFESGGEVYRMDWKVMDQHIAEGIMAYPGTMEPGVEFVFTFKLKR